MGQRDQLLQHTEHKSVKIQSQRTKIHTHTHLYTIIVTNFQCFVYLWHGMAWTRWKLGHTSKWRVQWSVQCLEQYSCYVYCSIIRSFIHWYVDLYVHSFTCFGLMHNFFFARKCLNLYFYLFALVSSHLCNMNHHHFQCVLNVQSHRQYTNSYKIMNELREKTYHTEICFIFLSQFLCICWQSLRNKCTTFTVFMYSNLVVSLCVFTIFSWLFLASLLVWVCMFWRYRACTSLSMRAAHTFNILFTFTNCYTDFIALVYSLVRVNITIHF